MRLRSRTPLKASCSVRGIGVAGDADVVPELLTDAGDFLKRLSEAFGGALHAAFVPHDLAEIAVKGIYGALALNGEELGNALADFALDLRDEARAADWRKREAAIMAFGQVRGGSGLGGSGAKQAQQGSQRGPRTAVAAYASAGKIYTLACRAYRCA